MKLSGPRPYVQRRRADAAAQTRERIVAAATRQFLEGGEWPTLESVAGEAGVAVQTVLRRFGSAEGLFRACVEEGQAKVAAERGAVTPGDPVSAIDNLVEHYAAYAPLALRLLWLAEVSAAAATVAEGGRALHRAWVERAFGPQLAALPADLRPERLALLVAATDVYTWKLLRQDQGLDLAATRGALLELVTLLTRSPP